MPKPAVPLTVDTREIGPEEDLLALADPDDPLVWLRRGDGMVGTGVALRLRATGADAAQTLAARWRALVENAGIHDPVGLAGTGLVGFGSLPFDARSPREAVLTVPAIVTGRRGDRFWRTTVRDPAAPEPPSHRRGLGPHWAGTIGPGRQSARGFVAAAGAALAAIRVGRVSKVVLARDLRGSVPARSDLRRLVRALASAYPDTWTFAVAGLIGASPETLVTVHGRAVTARVLAGTAARGADADGDLAASHALVTSAKDLEEHRYAVRSVTAALTPHTRALAAAAEPFALRLPNLWHLATDVDAHLANGASALDLVAALHPTAAVAGVPADAAVELIADLEPFDRGRYAGPVGWIDGNGDGEWAIALRCAQFDPVAGDSELPVPFTAYAGAGIVAGSDPESELLETRVKFRPIVEALA